MTMSMKSDVAKEMIGSSQKRLARLREEIAFEERYLKDLQSQCPQIGFIPKSSLTAHIVLVFKAQKRVLRAKEIVILLAIIGIHTDAKCGMLMNVNATLYKRKDLFERVDRGIYRLRESAE